MREDDACPECNGKIILKGFEKICEKCGLVEWIGGINNKSKTYVGLGERSNVIDDDLRKFIDKENIKSLNDDLLPPNETKYRIFNILNKVALQMKLDKNVCLNSANYYKKVFNEEKKIINNISLLAFCIFFAVRKENHNESIGINEISDVFLGLGHRINSRLILRDELNYKHYLME